MRANAGDQANNAATTATPAPLQRRVTELPSFVSQAAAATSQWGTRIFGGGSMANDGVFANLSAKPTRGEELEEKPPVRFTLLGTPQIDH